MFDKLIEKIKKKDKGCAGLVGLAKCPQCGEDLLYKTDPTPSNEVENVELHCYVSGCIKTEGYDEAGKTD